MYLGIGRLLALSLRRTLRGSGKMRHGCIICTRAVSVSIVRFGVGALVSHHHYMIYSSHLQTLRHRKEVSTLKVLAQGALIETIRSEFQPESATLTCTLS
jgi:hypothetical protein